MNKSTVMMLKCCRCSSDTQGRQWFKRDAGFGLCPACADTLQKTEAPKSMRSSFGLEGWHYGSSLVAVKDDFSQKFIDGTDAAQYSSSISGLISGVADFTEEEEIEMMENQTKTEPLVYSALFNAMKMHPETWMPTTQEMYYEMRDVVPPAGMKSQSFLMGEPVGHDQHDRAVFACFKRVGEEFFARHMTLAGYSQM